MFHTERLREIAIQPSFEELEKSRKRAEEREKFASVEEYAQNKLAEYKNNNKN
jgi:hypothetical protein